MQNVKIEPFKIVGIAVRTSNVDGRAAKDIPALWDRFLSEGIVDKIPNKTDGTIYSLYTDYEGDHMHPYTTILGCRVNEIANLPDGMTSRTFEGGDYVKSTVRGDLQKNLIVDEWMRIWNSDLNRNYIADFEMYGEKAMNPSDAEVDVFVGVNSL